VHWLVLEERHTSFPTWGLAALEAHGFGYGAAQVTNARLVVNNEKAQTW
jgi:hypothetical protein